MKKPRKKPTPRPPGKRSKEKGKDGERQWAKFLRELGFTDARRGAQHKGGEDSPDVVGLPGVHFEVKRTELLRLPAAMAQAKAECGENIPVVAHRRNNDEWLITMPAEHLAAFAVLVFGEIGGER